MSAFLYGVVLQAKLDIRSKSLLITCYVVPLLFFVMIGGMFTSLLPESRDTLIPSMTTMGISMGALIGVPPSLSEIYGSDIRNVYKANGVPLFLGLAIVFLSALLHLLLMSAILCAAAPLIFHAALPENLPLYFVRLALFITVSLSVGSVLGLTIKNQAKLTMLSQLVFLPSIMLSGILLSSEFLPLPLQIIGKIFPATWGYRLLLSDGTSFHDLWPLLVILAVTTVLCGFLCKKMKTA